MGTGSHNLVVGAREPVPVVRNDPCLVNGAMSKEPSPKPTDALTEALAEAVEKLASTDPHAAREAVLDARLRLDEAEGVALRAALARCYWRVKPAADLLGFPRHSALQKLLSPGARHAALGEEIQQHRDETGYHLGRPPALKPADDPNEPSPSPRRAPKPGRSAPPRRGQNAPKG